MDKVLQRILDKKEELGITDAKIQKDLGLYASAFSEWRSGRSKSYTKYIRSLGLKIGTTRQMLGQYELDRSVPSATRLRQIADALGISVADLI